MSRIRICRSVVLAAFLVVLFVDQTLAQTRDCDCSEAFADMIVKLEANYIGLRHRQLLDGFAVYEQRKSDFTRQAGEVDAAACTKLLGDFLRLFGDGHVFVFERPEYTSHELTTFGEKVREEGLSAGQLDEFLQGNIPEDGISGLWGDGKSEIAIVEIDGEYRAYILKSSVDDVEPGELKAALFKTDDAFKGTYYAYGHVPRFVGAGLYKEGTLLSFGGGVLWAKIESSYAREVGMVDASAPTKPTIEKLDDENTLLSIPSFLVDYKEFNNFLKKNKKLLQRTKNLLIDIRGNTGGNGIYFSLLSYFSDHSKPPGSPGYVLASEANLEYFRARTKNGKFFKQVVKDIENNMGEIVDGPAYPEKKMKRAKNDIENVVILTDDGCMSAAESFIIHAKEVSNRVTTFGSPTAGVIDYTSVNVLLLPSGNQNIYFGYPTSTYDKNVPENGHNQTGILPDVPIKSDVKDKVGFVLEHLRARSKTSASEGSGSD